VPSTAAGTAGGDFLVEVLGRRPTRLVGAVRIVAMARSGRKENEGELDGTTRRPEENRGGGDGAL
jgi:hypothetical protein